jgi:4,5-dihydroxyphthalate decarboxylase
MQYPMSGAVKLRTNLANYPVTKALKEGKTSSSVVALDFCGPPVAHDGFKGMVRDNKFDAGELAIITFLQAKAYGKPYVMLPAPISGRFQHHTIGYNAEHGELSPKDIEGRRVGVRSYAQTTGLWARGVLQHEYDVDLDRVTWVTFDDAHLAEYTDPPNTERAPKGDKKLAQMMFDGDVTAAILGADMPKDPRVRSLVPEPHKAAKAWFERTGVIPINHMFTVHEQVSRERPDVVQEIFRMLVESRRAAPPEALETIPPFGVEANRMAIQLAIDWALEQRIIPHRLDVDELFDDATRRLVP